MRFRGSERVGRRARGEASPVAAKRAAPSLPDLIALLHPRHERGRRLRSPNVVLQPHSDADPAPPERTVHPQAAN